MKKFYYKVIRKAITADLSDFVYAYFLLKWSTFNQLKNNPDYSKYNVGELFGITNDPQSPQAYSHYADTAMETLLEKIRPLVEKQLHKKLFSTYSYARIYVKGCDLKKHTDRLECETSVTLNLGGDNWPIYLEHPVSKKEIEVNLKQGDILIYKGCEVPHWRNKFNKNICVQAFLHYNEDRKENKIREFDGRPHLGLPKI